MVVQVGNVDPVVGRVQLPRLNQAGSFEAEDLIRRAVDFAAEVTRFGDAFPVTQLASAIVESMVLRTAPNGVALKALCEGRTSEGHIREFFGNELRYLTDIAVRATLALSDRTAIHEYLRAEPVRVGKESHALGVDHIKGAPHLANLIFCSIGCCDRNLINQADFLVTGTKHDRNSARADHDSIAEIEDELGYRLPGSVEEHVRLVLESEERSRAMVKEAMTGRLYAFRQAGIDSEAFWRYAFPLCLILDGIPWGPAPARSARDFADELFPGDDDEVLAAVENAGRYGIARCNLDEPETGTRFATFEDVLLPALADRLGENPEPVSPRLLEELAARKRANLIGVGANIRQVRFWFFPRSGRLLRAIEVSDQRGEYLDAALWRLVGLGTNHLQAAVALVERAHQSWPKACVKRYREDFEPGLMKASSARARVGLLRTSLVSNAGAVSAHKALEVRELRGRG